MSRPSATLFFGILGFLGLVLLFFFSPEEDLQAWKPETHPPGRPWKVQVVEKETGKPVPGAEVLVLDLGRVQNPQEVIRKIRGSDKLSQDQSIREFSRTYRCDEGGAAWIPALPTPLLFGAIEARKGNLWGRIDPMTLSAPPFRIEVTPFKVIRVQVKDRRGRPVAGVPVGLGLRSGPSFYFFFRRAETGGPDGIALFRRTNSFLQQKDKKIKGLAALLVPLKKPLIQEFDPRNPPSDPIVFTLPPTGKARLLVKGTKGPIPDDWCLAALCRKGKEKGEPKPIRLRPCPLLPVRGGRVLFPFVGLGLELKALVTAGQANFPFFSSDYGIGELSSTLGRGPARPGEIVNLRVTLGTPALLTGRLLLPSGKPAGESVFLSVHKGKVKYLPAGVRVDYLKTDKKGRFRLRLPSGPCGIATRIQKWILLSPAKGAPLSARLDLGKELPPGEVPLGDVRLHRRPLLASGKVTDPQGAPVPWARIEIAPGKQGPGVFLPAFARFLSGGLAGEDGRFRLFGSPPSQSLFIRASKPGWVPAGETRLGPGARGLTLVIQRAGRVEASFRADPGITLEGFPVSLVYKGPPERIAEEKIHRNRVLFQDLPPGKAALRVSLRRPSDDLSHYGDLEREPYLLAEIPGILVESGKTTRDPRLECVDLRGKIRLLELDLRDPGGKPIVKGSLRWGARFQNREWFFSKDPIFLPAGAPPTLWVGAPGCRPKKIAARGGKIRVVLEKGIPVELVYAGKGPLPAPPILLGVKIKPSYGTGGATGKKEKEAIPLSFTPESPQCFKKGNRIRLYLPAPGAYSLSWVLLEEDDPSGLDWRIEDAGDRTIHVKESGPVQVFRVSLPEKALRKALRAYKETREG